MKRLVLCLTASTLFASFGCSPASRSSGGNGGDNGSGGQGSSNGGDNGSGGSSSSGGVSGSGGESSSGGNQGNGGATDSGGSQGNGGSSSAGGSSGNGGSSDSGGSQGNGGSSSVGGSSGNGGAGGSVVSSNAVTFSVGQAQGQLTGWGWVALGADDAISDPTCDTSKTTITKDVPCKTATTWNQTNALCISGTIPALSEKPTDAEYASNWGVQVGVNAKEPNAAMGGPGYKTITFTVTGSPSSGLRALVHRSGDAADKGFCAAMTPGTALTLTTFNSTCWDSANGVNLTDADVPNIDQVSVQVTATASAITVDNLCLTKVEFGN